LAAAGGAGWGAGRGLADPPGGRRAVPGALMPSLPGRVVSGAPSASAGLQARRRKPPAGQRVTLVAGPGLGTGGAEVLQLPLRYPDAGVLGPGAATVAQVLGPLAVAWPRHLPAPGPVRPANPPFSR